MHEKLPDVETVVKDAENWLNTRITVRPQWRDPSGGYPYDDIGMAVDYRIRYYFGVTPVEKLAAWRGACELGRGVLCVDNRDRYVEPEPCWVEFFSALEETLDEISPARRKLTASEEELLGRYCYVLALLEKAYRAGPDRCLLKGKSPAVDDLLQMAEEEYVHDIRSLSWLFYDHYNHVLDKQAILNPEFAGSALVGGADAAVVWLTLRLP
jgi:hypothetical protein